MNTQGGVIHSEWMESVLLELNEGEWKVKFLQSDLVSRWLLAADGSRTDIYPTEDGDSDDVNQSSIPH